MPTQSHPPSISELNQLLGLDQLSRSHHRLMTMTTMAPLKALSSRTIRNGSSPSVSFKFTAKNTDTTSMASTGSNGQARHGSDPKASLISWEQCSLSVELISIDLDLETQRLLSDFMRSRVQELFSLSLGFYNQSLEQVKPTSINTHFYSILQMGSLT